MSFFVACGTLTSTAANSSLLQVLRSGGLESSIFRHVHVFVQLLGPPTSCDTPLIRSPTQHERCRLGRVQKI